MRTAASPGWRTAAFSRCCRRRRRALHREFGRPAPGGGAGRQWRAAAAAAADCGGGWSGRGPAGENALCRVAVLPAPAPAAVHARLRPAPRLEAPPGAAPRMCSASPTRVVRQHRVAVAYAHVRKCSATSEAHCWDFSAHSACISNPGTSFTFAQSRALRVAAVPARHEQHVLRPAGDAVPRRQRVDVGARLVVGGRRADAQRHRDRREDDVRRRAGAAVRGLRRPHSSALNAALASITLRKSEPEAGTMHLSGARTAGFGHLLSTFSTQACGWTPSPSVQNCKYVCACRCLRSS